MKPGDRVRIVPRRGCPDAADGEHTDWGDRRLWCATRILREGLKPDEVSVRKTTSGWEEGPECSCPMYVLDMSPRGGFDGVAAPRCCLAPLDDDGEVEEREAEKEAAE